MKALSLVIIAINFCICRYTSVEIKPELKKIFQILDMELFLNMKEC